MYFHLSYNQSFGQRRSGLLLVQNMSMHGFQKLFAWNPHFTGTGPSMEAIPPSSSVQEVKITTKAHLLVYTCTCIGLRSIGAKTVSPVDYFVSQQPIARGDSKLITACTTEVERLDSILSTAGERERERESKRKREKGTWRKSSETDGDTEKKHEEKEREREREREKER